MRPERPHDHGSGVFVLPGRRCGQQRPWPWQLAAPLAQPSPVDAPLHRLQAAESPPGLTLPSARGPRVATLETRPTEVGVL